ncbi:DUF4136 domain-containing protein [Shewanella eurypsychrophilus]|uniref:DUF4136 domain-containing protein n=1 Tax=Shewanella eurypsychrophilus TaxID=2593656 RepID=A0ABX6V3B3_9GAMM|nr:MULTISPECIES: DUF4136 domain-containing protein [Shewanella]QFU21552.1 DUF4136 domain-containing protein [Shewanella sp. YLB-09]QPG56842.1 DUF4136 domain-containing protein [Shewanella eurypsychrophilus]
MKISALTLLLISCLMLSACSSKPKSDYDTEYDFSQLKSFETFSPSQTDDTLSSSRIEDSIATALGKQGFMMVQQQADFNVTYSFKVEDKPKKSGLSIGLGTGSWGSSGGVSIGTSVGVPIGSDTAKIQTIQIDITNPKTNKLIWRGTDKFDFDAGGEGKTAETQETVAKILSQFPPLTK